MTPPPSGSYQVDPAARSPSREPGGGYGSSGEGGSARGGAAGYNARQRAGGQVPLTLARVNDKTLQSQYVFGNICAVSPNDFPPNRDGSDLYIRLTGPQFNGSYMVTSRPTPGFPDGSISLSEPQRTWCSIGMTDRLVGEIYDPRSAGGGPAYIGSMDLEVGFTRASRTTTHTAAYDPEQLERLFLKAHQNQIFAPGQRLLLDVKNTPLAVVVKTVALVVEKAANGGGTPMRSDPQACGILTSQSSIGFYKDARSPIKLMGSNKRPAANAILSPDVSCVLAGRLRQGIPP